MIRFRVVSIFPHLIDSYFDESLFKRAKKSSLLDIKSYDLRRFSRDRHKKVDDKPFGGGPGMVMSVDPVYRAVTHLKKLASRGKSKSAVILTSPRGRQFNAQIAEKLSRFEELILICGRYEGIDERVGKKIADFTLSIGPYVLSGGELPAMVIIEAVSRHLPGFLGKSESLENKRGSHPAYTRPAKYGAKEGIWSVPRALISGHHGKIAAWRKKHSSRT